MKEKRLADAEAIKKEKGDTHYNMQVINQKIEQNLLTNDCSGGNDKYVESLQ